MTDNDLDFETTYRSAPVIADELQDAEVAYAADIVQHAAEHGSFTLTGGGSTITLPASMLQRDSDGNLRTIVLSDATVNPEDEAEEELLRDANAHLAAEGADHFYGPWFPGTTGQQQSGYLSAQVGLENGRLGLLIDTGAFGNLQGDEFAYKAAAKAASHGLAT